jgi:hypothetical protein
MTHCPNCKGEMTVQSLEATVNIHPVEVGRCDSCCLLWFDDSASVRLSPRSVLELFKSLGTAGKTERVGADTNIDCPRCAQRLLLTHDIQRTTKFTYWRCPTDHGQLLGFTQFLREKNFVRTPSPGELAKIRSTVGQITCSHCGAPINLESESSCAYCGAAIVIVDPDSVAKAAHELQSAERAEGTNAGSGAIATQLGEAQVNALLAQEEARDAPAQHDLLAIGIGAMAVVLGSAFLGTSR